MPHVSGLLQSLLSIHSEVAEFLDFEQCIKYFDCAVASQTVVSGPDTDFFHKITPLDSLGDMPGDEEGCVVLVDVGTNGDGMSQNGLSFLKPALYIVERPQPYT